MTETKGKSATTRRAGSRFTELEIQRGLLALAHKNGNGRTASKALREQGLKISPTTLRRWRDHQHADLYLDLQQTVLPAIRERAAEMHTDLAEKEVELSGRLVHEL